MFSGIFQHVNSESSNWLLYYLLKFKKHYIHSRNSNPFTLARDQAEVVQINRIPSVDNFVDLIYETDGAIKYHQSL